MHYHMHTHTHTHTHTYTQSLLELNVERLFLSLIISTFTELYQGLVHFIFIDRNYGDMKMPSIFDEESLCVSAVRNMNGTMLC